MIARPRAPLLPSCRASDACSGRDLIAIFSTLALWAVARCAPGQAGAAEITPRTLTAICRWSIGWLERLGLQEHGSCPPIPLGSGLTDRVAPYAHRDAPLESTEMYLLNPMKHVAHWYRWAVWRRSNAADRAAQRFFASSAGQTCHCRRLQRKAGFCYPMLPQAHLPGDAGRLGNPGNSHQKEPAIGCIRAENLRLPSPRW